MASENYITLIDEAEAEYSPKQKGTSQHLDAGKKLISALNVKIERLNYMLSAPSVFNPNSPTEDLEQEAYRKQERERARKRKAEVKAELKNSGFDVIEIK
jgi:hypothetical protein